MIKREILPVDGSTDLMIQVTDDGSRTLIEVDSGVAFHSASGALAETRHVYLENSGIRHRLSRRQPTRVLEVGLGTAFGMLLTIDQAITHQTRLEYESIEVCLLASDLLQQLRLHEHLENPWIVDAFLEWRASLGSEVDSGRYVWNLGDGSPTAVDQDARTVRANMGRLAVSIECVVHVVDFNDFIFDGSNAYDAIYFDPFAPAATPELWSVEGLSKLNRQLVTDGKLTTYCVSREVREKFLSAGFEIQRVRGPKGGKREVLIATPSKQMRE